MLRWKVIEDNAGGLYLVVLEGGRAIYFRPGYEHIPGDLCDDLLALQAGEHPIRDGWEKPADVDDPHAAYDELMSGPAEVVADQDGIYYDRMGAAAQSAFCATVSVVEVGEYGEKHCEKIDTFTIPLEPLEITDAAALQSAMVEVAQRGHVIVPNHAGGDCVVTSYSDGRIEVAITVERPEVAAEIDPRDRFARALGFADREALWGASESVITQGDIDWYVTELPYGRYAAWDDAEIALDRVRFFDTRDEAVAYHQEAAREEEEED